ncbi:hypothetical protein BV898_02746 [Hypsibius exemplaris]|uniref:Uncharacterized protein n=1 Tax=Hypsibius exemplaris TaxID=2072580 RepID=A0A1W0X6Z7_HYPEX|nr:hypothetical protein BV898_02746 [Hypsibius exemplaris]
MYLFLFGLAFTPCLAIDHGSGTPVKLVNPSSPSEFINKTHNRAPSSPSLTFNLGDSPFRADLTSGTLEVAASNSHPRTVGFEAFGPFNLPPGTAVEGPSTRSLERSQGIETLTPRLEPLSFERLNMSYLPEEPSRGARQRVHTLEDVPNYHSSHKQHGFYPAKPLPEALIPKLIQTHNYNYEKSGSKVDPYNEKPYDRLAVFDNAELAPDYGIPIGHVPVWARSRQAAALRPTTHVYELATGPFPESFLEPDPYLEPARAQPPPIKSSRRKVFNYDDVMAAYHGRSVGGATYEPVGGSDPVPSAASTRFDQAMTSIYHSPNTVPYNTNDYKKYPYGYGGSRSGLSTLSFPVEQTESFHSVSPTFLDSNAGIFVDSSSLRGFPAAENPGRGRQFVGALEERLVAPSALAPTHGGLTTKQLQSIGAELRPRIHPGDGGDGQFVAPPRRVHLSTAGNRPTPGGFTSPFFKAFSPQTEGGAVGTGGRFDTGLSGSSSLGSYPSSFSSNRQQYHRLNLLAPILRNYLMRGDSSYERSDYDKDYYRHAPFLAAFLH